MGNTAGKDSHGRTGSPLDFFHTAPTTPTEAELAAMAFSTSFAKSQPRGTPPPEATTPPPPAFAHKLSDAAAPPEWAVISMDAVCSAEGAGRKAGNSISSQESPAPSLAPSQGSEQSWQERDSGLEPQLGAERAREEKEMTLVLLSRMEHYRASAGLLTNQDPTAGAVELLRRLIAERDELVEEVRSLKDTLRTERVEWQQFQCDLQVAVSVADRLRMEAEQALSTLQERHRAVEGQLAQALSRQKDTDRRLESLRAQHRDACRQSSALAGEQQQQQQQQVCVELSAVKSPHREERMESSQETEGMDSEPAPTAADVQDATQGEAEINGNEKSLEVSVEEEAQSVERQNEDQEQSDTDQLVSVTTDTHDPEDANGAGKLTGKGVAEAYLRTLAALEKKKELGGSLRDPKRIVMLSERSWSLSQLQLPMVIPTPNGASQNASSTLPLCKKEEPVKRRRVDRILQRQDSWSSLGSKEKPDDDQNSDSFRPQDGFSALLRRHGGSRRNSLLRWCQNRTQGYKNIEITNFSSSWEDGLAFCAVYHTYLPSHIPYSSLNPAEKMENLGLAFQTGETIGITATLSVEEMLKAGGPDWQRVLGYVESIFRHFEM